MCIPESLNENLFYLQRINITTDNHSEKLHQIILKNAVLAENILNNNNNPLCGLFIPVKEDSDKWLAFCLTLYLMRMDFNVSDKPDLKFRKGEKLLFNNKHVVEFEKFEGNNMIIRAADNRMAVNSLYSLSLDRKLQFQIYSGKKGLTSTKKIWAEHQASPTCPLDKILDISSMGNQRYFRQYLIYTGPVGKTCDFLRKIKVNKRPISEIINIAKINRDIGLSYIGEGPVTRPVMIISPDLYSANEYINQQEDKPAMLITAGSEYLIRNSYEMQQMIDAGIKNLVILDYKNINDAEYLRDEGIKIYNWDNSILSSVVMENNSKTVFFSNWIRKLTNNLNMEFSFLSYDDPTLSNVTKDLSRLRIPRSQADDGFFDIYKKLYKILNLVSSVIRKTELGETALINSELKDIRSDLEKLELFLPVEKFQNLTNIIDLLETYASKINSFSSNRISEIHNFLKKTSGNTKTCIIISQIDDKLKIAKFWKNLLQNDSCPVPDFHTIPSIPPDEFFDFIILPFWPGHKLLRHLHTHFNTNKIVIVHYPAQLYWYKSYGRRFNNGKNTLLSKSEMIPSPLRDGYRDVSHFSQIDIDQEFPNESENDIIQIELNFEEQKFSQYKGGNGFQTEKARRITFNNEKFAFFTASHKSIIINKLLESTSETVDIEYAKQEKLKTGDYILSFHSDKDVIRVLVDDKIDSWVRITAELWRKSLLNLLENGCGGNPQKLYKMLLENNLTKQFPTVLNWINNDEIIGPGSDNDLDIIVAATGDPLLRDNVDKVKNSIRQLRSAHKQAGMFIARKVRLELPVLLLDSADCINERIIEFEELGKAEILRIMEIDSIEQDIKSTYVNRILV